MAVDRNIYSRPPAAQSRRRGGGHLRRLWPAIPEREIEIDGNSSDAWRIVRHRGDVLGRIFAAPNGSYVYYRGPFNVTHETYTAPTLAGVVRAVRDLI